MDKEKTLRKLKQEIVEVENKLGVDPLELVGVVRCKNCECCVLDLSGTGAHLCMRNKNGFPLRMRVTSEDFCSHGERRDKE